MGHIVDKEIERPYSCWDCKHFLRGATCRAFDLIPPEIIDNPEGHTEVVPGQTGDYVFETDKPRDTMRIYVDEDEAVD